MAAITYKTIKDDNNETTLVNANIGEFSWCWYITIHNEHTPFELTTPSYFDVIRQIFFTKCGICYKEWPCGGQKAIHYIYGTGQTRINSSLDEWKLELEKTLIGYLGEAEITVGDEYIYIDKPNSEDIDVLLFRMCEMITYDKSSNRYKAPNFCEEEIRFLFKEPTVSVKDIVFKKRK